MIVGTRDLFGFERLVYHPRSGTWARGIHPLLQLSGHAAGEPDRAAIAGYLSGARLVGRTVLRDVLALPPGHALIESPLGLEVRDVPNQTLPADLETVLRASLQRALDSGKRVALALSGGLDSALLLALLRELGAHRHVMTYILATGMPDYCEQDAALELASQMQARVKIVRANEADFVAALARTTRIVEEPMFNLHPVAKLLLAEAMAKDGIELAITGDGADQVLRRDQSANYLPLCKALFDAASVRLHPPFVDAAVVAHLTSIAPDPHKQCLRELGARLNLPDRLVRGPKRGRLAPAMDLGELLERERIRALAASLDLPAPTLQTDTERVLWTTLILTLDHLTPPGREPPRESTMKRILFCVVPEKGHVNPCIGPAQHLQAADFEVAFYAPADISAQLDGAGHFTFLGPRATPERHDLSRGASFAANIRDAAWLRRWIHTLLIEQAPALVDGIRAVLQQWRPDVVVIDPLLYASAIAAELEGLPWVAMSNSLNPVLPDELDSDLLSTVRWLAPERERLFARYGIEARFRGCDILSPHLTLAFTTEDLVGQPPSGVELVGPALPAGPRGDETPFPWERIDPSRPLVYMSLGSQLYYQPEIFAKVIEAARAMSHQLVLSVGELVDTDLLPAADKHVIAVRYAPQLALLRRAQGFINHGGANSVMEALACGVPMLLSPFCNDQFHSAWFVERAGAGRCLDLQRATVQDIADALGDLLRPGPLRERAARIGAGYQRDGSAHAARRISELASGSRPARGS